MAAMKTTAEIMADLAARETREQSPTLAEMSIREFQYALQQLSAEEAEKPKYCRVTLSGDRAVFIAINIPLEQEQKLAAALRED